MQKKNKIIHIITRLDKGGSAENTLLTVLGLDKKKFDVILIRGSTFESRMSRDEQAAVISDLKKVEDHGGRLVTIPFLFRKIHIIYDLLAFFFLLFFLIKEKPLIVHTHTSKAGLLGRLAAKLAGVPIIVHTAHGHVFFGYFGPFKTKLIIFLERLMSLMTDRIVALTHQEKEDYVSFKIVKKEKCVVIASGIELERFCPPTPKENLHLKRELGLPDNALVVGTAGRLVPVKGPEYLIRAARQVLSRHPNTFFVFTGDGPLRPYLETMASDFGLRQKILFLGWRKDVSKVLSTYDLFILPSLNEGMGRVLAEAMALGKPIVASRTGGIPDLVNPGKNGYLVPPQDSDKLAEYILLLLEDREKRISMGNEGQWMALNFGRERMIKRIDKLYEDLMDQEGL